MRARSIRRTALVAATASAALALAVLSGGTAQAATSSAKPADSPYIYVCDFNTAGVRIHQDPDGASGAVLGLGYPGDRFGVLFSQSVYPYGTDLRTGVTGDVYYALLNC